MSKRVPAKTRPTSKTSELLEILGPPPVIRGESLKSYNRLYRRVREAVKPRDHIEDLWARDLTDDVWEALRFRRLKARHINALTDYCLQETLESGERDSLFDCNEVDAVMASWRRRDRDTVRLIKKELGKVGLTLDDVAAEALAKNLKDIERLDYMILQCEARRSAIMRELDRHRDAVSRQDIRQKLADAEDAEFEDLPPPAEEVPA